MSKEILILEMSKMKKKIKVLEARLLAMEEEK